MKPKIILSSLFLLLAQPLFAQDNHQEDVVYLKNGSIIRGFITEFVPEKSVTIKTAGQNLVFEMSEVEKITREEQPAPKKEYKIKDKGYFNETAMIFMAGGDKDDFTTAQSLTTVNGYQVNRFFRIGGGAGVTHYTDYSHTFFPLFARVSGDMIKHRITPVYYADAGYAFLVEKDSYDSNTEELSSKGGLMIHVGVGLKFYTAHRASFTLSAGFNLQKSGREYQYTWSEDYTYREERTYRRYTFGVGINF